MNSIQEFTLRDFTIHIIEKPAFEAIGFMRHVKLDGGDISKFIAELTESGQMSKLAATQPEPQQIWVCLLDCNYAPGKKACAVCDRSCEGFHTRCLVCVKKTPAHDFSAFDADELTTLHIPSSLWADFQSDIMEECDFYDDAQVIGYPWNEKIRLHFDNEHDWALGQTRHFWLPVKKPKLMDKLRKK
ncbi:MAG: hypothetical protein FWD06_08535 [Oscillospiraceae bacterium]|nr:hypothetical protein [Oscillospiraceae bacterium]